MRRVLALLWLVAMVAAPSTAAARDRTIVRDPNIRALYVLRGTVFYGTAVHRGIRWMRVVRGVRSRARAVPRDAAPGAIGLDAAGRVVVTLRTVRRDRIRWSIYDVARDRLSPFAVPTRCEVDDLAIWRARMAFSRFCGGSRRDVVVREPGRSRVMPGLVDFLSMRGRSVVGGTSDDEAPYLRVFVDRGRRCAAQAIPVPPVDHLWHAMEGVWIGSHGMEWVMGSADVFGRPEGHADLAVMAVHLDGGCSASATRWHIPMRGLSGVSQVAIDGSWLYYVTGSGLHRRRLTSPESATPPANDDVMRAAPLSGDLPLVAKGVVGHATREPGDPAPAPSRTVWYAWRPTVSERVDVGRTGWTDHDVGVFTGGPGPAGLARVDPVELGCLADAYEVVADRPYWIEVRTAGTEPSYEPFTLQISHGPLEHC